MSINALIDFIFGNLVFLFFVIGGIISFLKRAKQGQQQHEKRKPFMPPFGEVKPIDFPKVGNDRSKPIMQTTKKIRHNEPIEAINQPNPFYEKLREMEIKTDRIQTQSKAQQIQSKQSPVQKHNINLNIHNVTKKKVIEGLIWGEILGSPRAKKKHTYSYLKRG